MANGTYYSLLEVSERASAAEIKSAYIRLIREVHPDRVANAPAYWQRQAEEKTKEINEAYSVLSNRERRCVYDSLLAMQRRSVGTSSRQATSQAQTPPRNAGSEETLRYGYGQQQGGSTSTTPQFARRMKPGQRFFFAVLFCGFAIAMSQAFLEASSIEDEIFLLLIATALFFASACLYQRLVRRLLATVRIRRPKQQLWATIGAIALMLSVGKIAHSKIQKPVPVPISSLSGATGNSPSAKPHPQEISLSTTTPLQNSLENGTELRKRLGTNGLGELTVENGNSDDAVVVVVKASTNRTIRSFYVRSEMSFTEKNIPPGTYEVYFFTGTDWNPDNRSFNRDKRCLEFGKDLEYAETKQQEGDQIAHYFHKQEITLQPVAGGTVLSSPIDSMTVEQLLNQPEVDGDK